jgi:dTDP-4-amino-4,6-dideoxygalactose transaminase
VNYRAIHLLSYFKNTFGFQPGMFPAAERIGDCTVSLPFYPAMTEEQVAVVAEALKGLL